jgi:hypothetical protein
MPNRFRLLAPLVASLVIALAAAGCASRNTTPIVESDPRPDVDLDPRVVFARIQSNLERVAAQRARHVLPANARDDGLENVVDAYAAYLAGDIAAMDAALGKVTLVSTSRRARPHDNSEYERREADAEAKYFAAVDAAAKSPQPLLRLLAGLRNADSVLLLEAAPKYSLSLDGHSIDSHGPAQSTPDPLSYAWLRLPCRTLQGRVADFNALRDAAKPLGGPLLGCARDDQDFGAIEKALAAPQDWPAHAIAHSAQPPETPPPEHAPAPPWDRETAAEWMAENPDAAETALAAATDDGAGKLDYALFLHAFRPQSAERDAKIATLLQGLIASPGDEDEHYPEAVEGADRPYDGSDASLVPKIVVASEYGLAQTQSAFYAIPCDVLIARPGLLAAADARYYSNRDNFTPRSGCAWGRGHLRDFPGTEVDAFMDAAAEADGYFIATFEGTMKYGFETVQAQAQQTLALDPRGLLARAEPKLDYPYQTWSLLGLGNKHTGDALKVQYEALLAKIAALYQTRGLSADESRRAAKTGLFALVLGANCGDASPQHSPRATLLAGGVPDDLATLAPDDATHDAPETEACAEFAGMDPLLHVAVASPRALDALLARGGSPDLRDSIGKTPLMLAAQHDRIESAKLLLAHHAAVDATTYVKAEPWGYTLSHDARTPLMYAAASGSLEMIRLLLDAGADPYRADSKGRRALDYLLGFGPVGANRKLSELERKEAARLLF